MRKSYTVFLIFACAVLASAPVGSFEANEFGLFDKTGNVSEWCADWYEANYYASSPKRPASGAGRVLRGGSWSYNSYSLRCAFRYRASPTERGTYDGFRCAQDVR